MDITRAEARLLRTLPKDGTPMSLAEATAAGEFAADAQVLAAAERPIGNAWVGMNEQSETTVQLTDEGQRVAAEGLPERRAWQAIQDSGGSLPMGGLGAHLSKSDVSVAIGWLKRKGWADIVKDGGPPNLVAKDAPEGADEATLAALAAGQDATPEGLKMLDGRGLLDVTERTIRHLMISPEGIRVRDGLPEDLGEEVNQVTPELIAKWADMSEEERARTTLRPFAFDAAVEAEHAAKPHPLQQLMSQIRGIFWQMGFGEIQGDYVESAFWNMDALFIPQDHPAREEQDTFYLEQPATLALDHDEVARVKAVHETGGDTGSAGWGGSWSSDIAAQGLLRTHTTNTTIRYLAEHFNGQGSESDVHRVFGLGKVFRNETMDATHLPEFHQIEGIVTEEGASFDMLIGLARHFFTQMGFPEVRFRPAYFPYTEPSMEIDVLYNGKWMELGGCGVFRPEVTEPLGVPHPVLAWGFGLERLAMMRLGLKDIRQLYISDVQWLKQQPLL